MEITSSQNKKIAIAAVSLFTVSFSILIFFLSRNDGALNHGQSNVLHSQETGEAAENDAPYMKVFETIKSPKFVTNEEGLIKYADEGFCKMLDVDCEKILENSFFDFINSKDVSGFAAAYGKIIHDGKVEEGLGPYRVIEGKKELLLLFQATPVLDENEKVSYVIFSVKDITEQAEELNKKAEKNVQDDNDSEEYGDTVSPENFDENWIENFYPKFEELKDFQQEKLMAGKTA